MTAAQRHALVTRADLLASECALKIEDGVTWAGRARALAGYGRSGGSALDRRLVAEAMAALEREDRA